MLTRARGSLYTQTPAPPGRLYGLESEGILIKCPLSADYKMPSLVLRSSALAAENMSDFLRPYRSPSMLAVAASSSAPTVNPRDGDCCEFAAHPPILVGEPISRLHYRSRSLQPVDLLAL